MAPARQTPSHRHEPRSMPLAPEPRAPAREAPAPRLAKIMVLVTEDWFALSHFQPLLRTLKPIARDVVVVTRSSGRMGELEALGCRTVDLDYNRSSMNPVREAKTVRRLREIIRAERPDVIHMIAMKPIVLGGIAILTSKVRHPVVHMTGLGFLAISETAKARAARRMALGIIRRVVARPGGWLFVENPEDLTFLKDGGVTPGHRVTMLGGAGIDPDAFPAWPETGNQPPVAAFVARMIRSKGVGVLMDAADILARRGVPLAVALYGDTDDGNPEAIPRAEIEAWSDGSNRRYMGFTRDVAAVWRTSDIFVLPAISREGMPRALLEAAACGRAVVVTDVPGCRHFVHDGINGLIVPPGDAAALAAALERLARDPDLRARLGRAARQTVLAGYTEDALGRAVTAAYADLAGCR